MDCIINCAGYGTRLEEVGKNKPKSLLEISKGFTILDIIIKKIKNINVDKIIVIHNNKFKNDFSSWYNNLNNKEGIFNFCFIKLRNGQRRKSCNGNSGITQP